MTSTASARKDRYTALGIHYAPAHVSKEEFKRHIERRVDSYLATAVAQKNILKVDIMFPTDMLDAHAKGLGVEPRFCACVRVDYPSEQAHAETVADSEFQKALATEKGLGYSSSGSFAFGAETIPVVSATLPRNIKTAVGVFPAPPGVSGTTFQHSVKNFLQGAINLPSVQKYNGLFSETLFAPENIPATYVESWGFPSSAPVVVVLYEVENWDTLIKFMEADGVKGYAEESFQKLGLGKETNGFAAEVIVKKDETAV